MKTLSKMDLMAICLCFFGMGVASSVAVYGTYTLAEGYTKNLAKQQELQELIEDNRAFQKEMREMLTKEN